MNWRTSLAVMACITAGLVTLVGSGSSPTSPTRQCFAGQAVTIPTSDASAPSVVADVFLPDGRTVSLAQGTVPQTISSATSGQVAVIAKAIDAQGVKDIQIWASEKRCTFSGATATCSGPGSPGRPTASNPDAGLAGGSGCTERLVSLNLNVLKNSGTDVSHEVGLVGLGFGGQPTVLGTFVVKVQ